MRFPDQMAELAATEPFDVSYVVILYEGTDGQPPNGRDAEVYADQVGLDMPVLADWTAASLRAMPWEGERPFRCAVSPRMELLTCYTGEPESLETDPALQAIRAHWTATHGG